MIEPLVFTSFFKPDDAIYSAIVMKIDASQCSTCSRAIVPQRQICPYCGFNSTMQNIELECTGKIISYTTLQVPPEGHSPPLTMALVRLEHDASVLCLLEDGASSSRLSIGLKVLLGFDSKRRLRFSPV